MMMTMMMMALCFKYHLEDFQNPSHQRQPWFSLLSVLFVLELQLDCYSLAFDASEHCPTKISTADLQNLVMSPWTTLQPSFKNLSRLQHNLATTKYQRTIFISLLLLTVENFHIHTYTRKRRFIPSFWIIVLSNIFPVIEPISTFLYCIIYDRTCTSYINTPAPVPIISTLSPHMFHVFRNLFQFLVQSHLFKNPTILHYFFPSGGFLSGSN